MIQANYYNFHVLTFPVDLCEVVLNIEASRSTLQNKSSDHNLKWYFKY